MQLAEAKRPRGCSIELIYSAAAYGELTEEQKQRWLQFKEAMVKKGWSVLDLVGTTDMLRTSYAAHAKAKKRTLVTVCHPKTWTSKFFNDALRR